MNINDFHDQSRSFDLSKCQQKILFWLLKWVYIIYLNYTCISPIIETCQVAAGGFP